MLQQAIERELLADHQDGDYVFPAYDDYCFAGVSETALSVLNSSFIQQLPDDVFDGVSDDGIENVVVLLMDGFGYEDWKRNQASHPFLSALTEHGTVTPLTSVYPSETAAAMTTNHTGMQPVEHGLLGWYQYYQEFGGLVQTLPFTTQHDAPAREAFENATPEVLFEGSSIYSRAEQAGIDTYVAQPAETIGSAYSQMTIGDASALAYKNVAEMGLQVRQALESATGPTFVFAYVPTMDAVAHASGTDSSEYQTQLAMVTECVRRELVAKLDSATAEKTLLFTTADHGHIDTQDNIDISDFTPIWDNLQCNQHGDPIPPVGSARNVQLHLQSGTVESVRNAVETTFDVRTFTRDEFSERHLFGTSSTGNRFQRQCPDLVISHRENGLWWETAELELVGMHGGLSREEMLVPFAAANIASLPSRA